MIKYYLNAGHGVETKGKRSPFVPPGVLEYQFNRDIAHFVEDEWDARINETGYTPMTVTPLECTDNAIPLKRVVRIVNGYRTLGGDPFLISIHANAAGNAKKWYPARGTKVFIHPSCGPRSESFRFAKRLSRAVSKALDTKDRGVGKRNFKVLGVKCPAVLLECGFMTNSGEATKLASTWWKRRIAGAIYKEIERHSKQEIQPPTISGGPA